MKKFKHYAIAVLCVLGLSMSMTAQTTLPQKGYYLGISTGASMGTCAFRSYTDNGKTARAEYGVSAGYRFSNLFSLELSGMRGNVEMTSSDGRCDEMWLGLNGMFIESDVMPPVGWKGKDLTTTTKFARFAVQGNFNILYIFKNLRDSRWKLDLSPMISMVQTHTTAGGMMFDSGEYNELEYKSQWHFACGGQGSIGVAVDNNIEVRLYAGINFLSGDRFDNLVNENGYSVHTENLMYEGGAKLSWNFGNSGAGKAAAVVEKEAPTDLSGIEERLETIQDEIVRMREEAEKAGQEQPVQSVNAGDCAMYSVVFGRYPFSVFFDLDSAELRSDNDRINIKTFADFAKKYGCMIRLRGTCDEATGSVNHNQVLSERRCNTVKDELVKFGMNANDIVIEAAGGVSEFENIESNRRVYLDFVK